MSDFNTFTKWPAVHGQNLTAVAEEVSAKQTHADPLFAKSHELMAKWEHMPGKIPHFRHVKPAIIGPDLLPSLFILEVVLIEDCEPDFRWRLFGTANRQHYGIEATGSLVSSALGLDASITESLRLARLVYQLHKPRFMKACFMKDTQIWHQARSVILPLSGDDGSVERIFGCTIWTD